MPSQTKIVLSDKELDLVTNTGWILTKQQITGKVYELLNAGITDIDAAIHPERIFDSVIATEPPKISKGENYLGLPYVTLDHPRSFGKDIFAIRTMFWWGHFFSITLHIAGNYKKDLEERIIAQWDNIPDHFFICIHDEQWHHHFESGNYKPVRDMTQKSIRQLTGRRDFIKLAVKFGLHDFNDMQELLAAGYKQIGKIIG
jgi:hypothetical protein